MAPGVNWPGMQLAQLVERQVIIVQHFERRRDELAFDHGVPAIAATDSDFRTASLPHFQMPW